MPRFAGRRGPHDRRRQRQGRQDFPRQLPAERAGCGVIFIVPCPARPGEAMPGKAMPGMARAENSRLILRGQSGVMSTAGQGLARHGEARRGTARHGVARHGEARHGEARQGLTQRPAHRKRWVVRCESAYWRSTARPGTARHGMARRGEARRGEARPGTAQQGPKTATNNRRSTWQR